MTALQTLPSRAGRRPSTTTAIPHAQLDQQPADGRLVDEILSTAGQWPRVRAQSSGISVEGARALALADSVANGGHAFITGTEFCHVHAQGDHSLHATLPVDLAHAAAQAGWAEPHFLVHSGDL